jgi:hypothetical protein
MIVSESTGAEVIDDLTTSRLNDRNS